MKNASGILVVELSLAMAHRCEGQEKWTEKKLEEWQQQLLVW